MDAACPLFPQVFPAALDVVAPIPSAESQLPLLPIYLLLHLHHPAAIVELEPFNPACDCLENSITEYM